MNRRALLQGILDAPEDDAPRLVFADWLDDNGEPDRAEFIRAQIQSVPPAGDDPICEGLRMRAAQLLARHFAEWVREVPGWARHEAKFVRGFVRDVVCTAASFARRGARLFENAPVQGIRLTKYAGLIAQVTSAPHTRLVTAVTLTAERYENRLSQEDVAALSESAWAATLESLDLSLNWLGREEMEVLTRSDFPRLDTLILNQNYLRQEGLRVLLDWPSLRHIRRLGLFHNVFCTTGMGPIDEMIRQSPNLEALLDLDISDSIDPASLPALTHSATLRGLQSLNLSWNKLDDSSCALLARSPYLTKLQNLDLTGNQITASGVEALINSPGLHSPCRICLMRNRIKDSSKESLRRRLVERFGPNVSLESQSVH
jgi:uncharacterized protein (TIGR02996 family)